MAQRSSIVLSQVVHIPAHDSSAAVLGRLTGRWSGALRAVSG
ncbi:hypothetical protein [Streptomyces spiralis]